MIPKMPADFFCLSQRSYSLLPKGLRAALSTSGLSSFAISGFLKAGMLIDISRVGPEVILQVEGFRYALEMKNVHDYLMYRNLQSPFGYERGVVGILRSVLDPGDIFVDVGANNGFFSLLGSELVGPAGVVLAFEPNRETFARLERNLSLNRVTNVMPFALGLWDSTRTAALYHSAIEDGSDTIMGSGRDFMTVHLSTLDDAVHVEQAKLIKIDAEGAEGRVMKGIANLLARSPSTVLVVECNSNYDSAELASELGERFELFRLEERVPTPPGWLLSPISVRQLAEYDGNLLCLPTSVPLEETVRAKLSAAMRAGR